MKAFQVCGFSNSGKTTVLHCVIKQLVRQNYHVASVKSIHSKDFAIDQTGTDTYIQSQAGADPVVAHGFKETDILFQHQMSFLDIANKISADWLVVEGLNDFPLPKIVCGKTEAELEHFVDRRTFAIAGVISKKLDSYENIPIVDVQHPEHQDRLIELIKLKVPPLLPYVDDACCGLCGLTCSKLVEAIIQGEKTYEDCTINQSDIQLKINGREIPIVPFVQRILRNNVLAVVSELSGWEKDKTIEIKIRSTDDKSSIVNMKSS